jgi:hypothetical protein
MHKSEGRSAGVADTIREAWRNFLPSTEAVSHNARVLDLKVNRIT